MVKPRVVETDEGIQGEYTVQLFDAMARRLRDKGYMATDEILQSGIRNGSALEISCGPGYLGLEWLKHTDGTRLTALDISEAMLQVARRNAREYGLEDRVTYIHGDATKMPFDRAQFDAVFTNGALHEWAVPTDVFNEIDRLLRPGGRYCVTDLRRDMNPLMKWLMKLMCRPKEIRPGLVTSIDAAYTAEELEAILRQTRLADFHVSKSVVGLCVTGQKALVQHITTPSHCPILPSDFPPRP